MRGAGDYTDDNVGSGREVYPGAAAGAGPVLGSGLSRSL
jgi:hypothetical protein